MNKLKSLFISCAALLLFTGCAQQQQVYETIDQICLPGADKASAMHATEDVLGQLHFSIDKSDADLGVVRTQPLPAAQFFELWRKDNIGNFNSAEANLHTIRRIAELNINQQGGQLCIRCNVNTQRLRLPEREIRSRARAYELFSQSGPSIQTMQLHPSQKRDMAWVDLGNDPQLATVILKQIENKLSKTRKGNSL